MFVRRVAVAFAGLLISSALLHLSTTACSSAEPTPDIAATVRAIVTESLPLTATPIDAAGTAVAVVMAIPPEPTVTPAHTATPAPIQEPIATGTPAPTATPPATATPVDVRATVDAIVAAFTPVPTDTPIPPTANPTPQPPPTPVDVPATVEAIFAAFTPVPTETPIPTVTPVSTPTPAPTATPIQVPDPESTAVAVVLAQPTVTPIPIPSDRADFAKIIERVKESVVLIRGDAGDGSGFVIHPDGFILTNEHVVVDDERLSVLIDGISHTPEIVAMDAELDVAILKINPKGVLKSLPLADAAWVGEEVIVVGYPLGLKSQVTASKGIISGFPMIENVIVLQTDAATNSGNSGGPVVNLYGEVVGMAKSGAVREFRGEEVLAQGVNYAVHLSDLRGFWERRGKPAPTPTPLPTGNATLIHGPTNGTIDHHPEGDTIDDHEALVWLADGIVEVSIHNPFAPHVGDWSVGLNFRSGKDGGFYVIMASDGRLYHQIYQNREYSTLSEVNSRHIDVGNGRSNKLRLVMRGKRGELWINGARAGILDLSRKLGAGDASVVGSFFTGHGLTGHGTEFTDLKIWKFEGSE